MVFYICVSYVLARFWDLFGGPLLFGSLRGLRSFRSQEGRRTAEGLRNLCLKDNAPNRIGGSHREHTL